MTAVMRMLLMVGALLLLPGSAALWPCKASACSCTLPDIKRLTRQADAIVIGRTTEEPYIQDNEPGGIRGMTIAVVRVETSEKGRPARPGGRIRIYAFDTRAGEAEGLEGCNCRQSIPVNDYRFRMFLKKDADRPGLYQLIDTEPVD